MSLADLAASDLALSDLAPSDVAPCLARGPGVFGPVLVPGTGT